ncbi:uncharacterized protein KQ657_001742 [Scheffersomyces spartinae]|uniref:Ribosome maturation protein SDO1 n=1 Tax=Scheffersomyces spartinae TaxID=45513 RepID=A0A9P8AHN5_9ASCO|nr:uncharacterized protein KQ657_001742 [Scheffersomyces spartinae]KAG7192344.1 hypothetical protein KQ657_001742 [Scheffersomyces spartinae]
MAVINQPNSQIRLTNVSIVRMKKGKKRFEIACYQNKIQDWRSRIEKDIDEVLQIPLVFINVSKGLVANNEDLLSCFGKTNQDEIILEILDKGEIQLNEKERNANLQQKQNEFLTIILTKCISSRTKKKYPPSMILKALNELKFHLNPVKPAKTQALEAIRLLVSEQLIPIARAQMQVKVVLLCKVKDQVWDEHIMPLFDHIEDENQGSKLFSVTGIIDPINYKAILDLLQGENALIRKGQGSIEVLNMATIKED